MKKLKQKAGNMADAAIQKARENIGTALAEELSDDLTIEETSDGVAISGPDLGVEILGNSSLRDVAFLMRGVR